MITGKACSQSRPPRQPGTHGSFALLGVVVALLTCPGVHGFYEKGSDVVTLRKSNWKKEVLESEYLYVVEFYREGCGYCQLLTPIYEKLAGSMKHMVKVGAVNTEREGALANDHGDPANPISGVPTIKLFKPKKNGRKHEKEVIVYNGERKAKAMADFMSYHMPSYVKAITLENYDRVVGESEIPVCILFTDHNVSALYKALSTEYKGKTLLTQVYKKEAALLDRFNVTNFPTLVALAPERHLQEVYTGKISLTSINMWLWKLNNKWAKQRKKSSSSNEL